MYRAIGRLRAGESYRVAAPLAYKTMRALQPGQSTRMNTLGARWPSGLERWTGDRVVVVMSGGLERWTGDRVVVVMGGLERWTGDRVVVVMGGLERWTGDRVVVVMGGLERWTGDRVVVVMSGLERWTGDRVVVVMSTNPAAATSLRNFGNSVYPLCQCLSGETLKAVGPFSLVSMFSTMYILA